MSIAMLGVPFNLQASGATTGNGTPATINPSAPNHVVHVKGTGTITAGTISIEEADTEEYTGTWSVIQTVAGTDVTAGAQKAIHLALGIYRAIRARISVNIAGGGSVEVLLISGKE